MLDNISILAGSKAINIIQDEGLDMSRVKVIAGASGSAKFLVLTGIDRVLMSLFRERTDPLYLIGTSIGAFRMAAFCQKDPLQAIGALEREYIAQHYEVRPAKEDIARETQRILDAYIDDKEIEAMLDHPFMRISFLANKCKGLLKSERFVLQMIGLGLAAGVNLLSRNRLGFFFERALFCGPGKIPPFASMNQFPLNIYGLTPSNFKSALISSGSIPIVMEGIASIEGAPGLFRDGGILDYHLDIPFLPKEDGLVLFPHFYEKITPGWFDKRLNRKPCSKNMENVVLVAPSNRFVKSLPFAKIPDRKDFNTFKGKDNERMAYWKIVVEKNKQLGDEFFEAIQSGKIRQIVKPL
ncbi:MAG: patatin-like phospholipase family protein [Deltaproteobacteria bacterium]|uniref:patatin-like phospholipase family protein n=1 Tax=Desulfobacula sp. TaxID=2593537 RepID=UPI0019BC7217|nr:patatin-like phospholipase family protein [Candidatus Desulfobacula maris]MBL6994136.1 patatin-like phospholipase family protein [Desulfobacula sp.]